MDMGDRLKHARLSAGYAQQKEVADKLGIERTRYLKWEHGDAQPPLDYVVQMCKLFGVSSDYLLGIQDELNTRIQFSADEVKKLRKLIEVLE